MKRLLDKLRGRSGDKSTATTTQNLKGTLYQDGFFETEKTNWLGEHYFSYLLDGQKPIPKHGVRIPSSLKNEVNLFLSNNKSNHIVLPRQPKLLPKLIHAINHPKSSTQQVLSLITSDPKLATEVIRYSNSAFYKTDKGNVTSLKRAVDLLGHNGLRRIATNIALSPIIKISDPSFPGFGLKLWEYSTQIAIAAEELARVKSTGAEKAYLLGLTSTLGAIVLYQLMIKYLGACKKEPENKEIILHKLIETYQWQLNLKIFEEWGLPENMMHALTEQSNKTHPGKMSVYGNILYQARLACMAYVLMKEKAIPAEKGKLVLLVQGLLKSQMMQVFDQLKSIEQI